MHLMKELGLHKIIKKMKKTLYTGVFFCYNSGAEWLKVSKSGVLLCFLENIDIV